MQAVADVEDVRGVRRKNNIVDVRAEAGRNIS